MAADVPVQGRLRTMEELSRRLSSELSREADPAGTIALPALREIPKARPQPSPELKAALETVTRAAELSSAQGDEIERLSRRVMDGESRAEELGRQLAQTQAALRQASDEAAREKGRADDLQRRSNELLERTQAMLTDASEQLLAAETRAGKAEGDLSYLTNYIQERFGV